jgi:uncharacterized membrane protein YozB (DUF420 family)
MNAPTLSQINLAFQIMILVILFVTLALWQKHKNFLHGLTMLIAVVLNIASFLVIMLPSLLSMGIPQLSDVVSLVIFAHVTLGVTTMILGLWLVGSWHLQSSVQNCAAKKKVMRLTAVLWLVALLLGVLLYVYLYTSLIP